MKWITLMARRSMHIPKIKIISMSFMIHCKLAILGNLGMLTTPVKNDSIKVKRIMIKKSTPFLTLFLRCHKDIINFSGYFRHAWPNP